MTNSGEFVTERSAQCDACWNWRSCEGEEFKDCAGYRFGPRCPEHPDKPLVPGPSCLSPMLYVCPECHVYVCRDCGFTRQSHQGSSYRTVGWSTGLCTDCHARRDAVEHRRAQRVAYSEKAYAFAADSILSADSDWSLAVSLADLSAKRDTLKEVRGW